MASISGSLTYDVAVVGSEAASVAAADLLKKKGVNVLVFAEETQLKVERCAQGWILQGKEKSATVGHVIFAVPIPALQGMGITPYLPDNKKQTMANSSDTPSTGVSVAASPDPLRDVKRELVRPEDSLFFCREHTSDNPASTIGASELGTRAAKEVLSSKVSCALRGDNIPIHSISELKAYLPDDDDGKKTLVVYDLDDTLIVFDNPAFQWRNFTKTFPGVHMKTLSELDLTESEMTLAFELPLLTTPAKLIENESPDLIKRTQSGSTIKAVALTAATAWELDKSQKLTTQDTRVKGLVNFDIDFFKSFPGMSDSEFVDENFKGSQIARYPFFKKGVVFTNKENKGEVLKHFLGKIQESPDRIWSPDRIIVVDDNGKHLNDIRQALKVDPYSKIELVTLHYQPNQSIYDPIDLQPFKEEWMKVGNLARKIIKEEGGPAGLQAIKDDLARRRDCFLSKKHEQSVQAQTPQSNEISLTAAATPGV